jgi:glycosyltransferase 2 family protein
VKFGLYIAALLGLVLAIAIVIYNNAELVLGTLFSQGPGLIGVIAFHAVPLFFSAAAWWVMTRTEWRQGRLSDFIAARLIREAVNDLLPTAQVGGPLAGARLLTLRGAPGAPVAASLFVDVTGEVASELIFVFMGIGLLALDGRAPEAVRLALIGTAIMGPAVIGFVFAQRAGLVRMIDRFVRDLYRKLGRGGAEEPEEELHDIVWRIYGRLGPLSLSFVLHIICWVLGAGELYLALWLLGERPTIAEAIVLESLGQAIRSAAFVVPAGLGVQEGGFLVLGAAFGLSAPVSLALSLTKRVREVAFGGLSLLGWQILEGRKLAQSLRAPAAARGNSEA